MSITTKKLEEFIADRIKYFEGNLDCNRSGINNPENSKYKESIDKGLEKYTKVDPKNRPHDGDTYKEGIATGMSFQDSQGKIHKALGKGERLYNGGDTFSVGKIIRAKIVGNYEGLNDVEQKAA